MAVSFLAKKFPGPAARITLPWRHAPLTQNLSYNCQTGNALQRASKLHSKAHSCWAHLWRQCCLGLSFIVVPIINQDILHSHSKVNTRARITRTFLDWHQPGYCHIVSTPARWQLTAPHCKHEAAKSSVLTHPLECFSSMMSHPMLIANADPFHCWWNYFSLLSCLFNSLTLTYHRELCLHGEKKPKQIMRQLPLLLKSTLSLMTDELSHIYSPSTVEIRWTASPPTSP